MEEKESENRRNRMRPWSFNKAADRYLASLERWDWHQFTRFTILIITVVTVGIGLKYPAVGSAGADGTSVSIYDAAVIQRYRESDEARFYEYPITVETQTSQGRGPMFLYSLGTEERYGFYYSHYRLTYDLFGRILAKEKTDSGVQEAVDSEYRPGSAFEIGAYMYPYFTRFGVDCEGCSGETTGIGNFAMGVHYDKNYGVRQWDGTYKPGVTYEGYYIVAADMSIPFCTVLRIENHQFIGSGLQPGVPFEVIVLDRGGAIEDSHFDLFIGLQTNMEIGYGPNVTGNRPAKATIVKFGTWATNYLGQLGCRL